MVLPTARELDGPGYPVSGFELKYVSPLPGLPELDAVAKDFNDLEVALARVEGGFVEPRPGAQGEMLRISELTKDGPTVIYARALDVINRTLIVWFRKLAPPANVFVCPSPDDIDPVSRRDLRGANRQGKLLLLMAYDGPFYPISGFELVYKPTDHPDLPRPEEALAASQVKLVQTPEGYVAWRPGAVPVIVPIAAQTGKEQFSAGAIQVVLEAVYEYFHTQAFLGIRVNIAPGELNVTLRPDEGGDLRQNGRTTLRLQLITGRVTAEPRTLARGDRIKIEERENNPAHARIREKSPFKPAGSADEKSTDLLRQDVLDNYLSRLSRHPGRRVDASIAPATLAGAPEEPYGLALDFHVSENKPWVVYGQTSNTGTAETAPWRVRVGVLDNQLTGNDDILSFEWINAGARNNAVLGLYEGRVFDSDTLRWRVYANWAEFASSEVGFADEDFTGYSTGVGGELIWNVFQKRQLFIDVFGGALWADYEVINNILPTEGQQDYFIPYVGARLQRFTDEAYSDVVLQLLWNIGYVDPAEINLLGHIDPAEHWVILRWDGTQSFYLEPLLNRMGGAESPNATTLAHEFFVRFRGQTSFGSRLIPQQEQVAGGMFSIRGYPEAVAVGDSVLIANLEYRFHLPRALGINEEPQELLGRPFRWVPQHPYGQTDWDLILKGFVDVGATYFAEPFSFEPDNTLLGIGIGAEFQFLNNVNIQLDWGFALEGIAGEVDAGSNRIHFAATLLY